MSTIAKLLKPGGDTVVCHDTSNSSCFSLFLGNFFSFQRLTVNLGETDMDPFVFAVLPARVAPKLHKELQDLV